MVTPVTCALGDEQLAILADIWDRFFTETLPTLQAIFYPVQVKLKLLWLVGGTVSVVQLCVCGKHTELTLSMMH